MSENSGREPLLITDFVPDYFIEELEKLNFSIGYFPDLNYEETLQKIKFYSALLIRSRQIVDRNLLENAEKLKIILRPGSGLENVDKEFATQKGIKIVSSPEGNRGAVAEHAIGMLLGYMNNIPRAFEEVRAGTWQREENRGRELKGSTIGIIGYGNTGQSIAKRLSGFEVNILAYDKYKTNYSNDLVREASMDDIFEQADILTLHVPLNKETTYLVDMEFFGKFKKPILLINTSRGKVVNTKDLLTALDEGLVTGACLDVLENENLLAYNKEERKIFYDLVATRKVIITPHIAGWNNYSKYGIYNVLLEKLRG